MTFFFEKRTNSLFIY